MAQKSQNMWGDLPDDDGFDPVPSAIKEAGVADLKDGEFELIERPNVLKAKTGPGTGADGAAIARAEHVVETFKESYEQRVGGELEDIDALFTEMMLTKRFDLRRILIAVHEVRGEAGTYDYPLLSEIARSLCELLPQLENPTAIQLEVITAHIKAMRTIVAHKIKDDGGDLGKQVVKSLVKAVQKMKGEEATANG